MDKRKLIRQISVIVILVLYFIMINCMLWFLLTKNYLPDTSRQMQTQSVEVDRFLPFDDDSGIVKISSDTKLSGELPVVDGAAALFPVFSAFVNAVYPQNSVIYDNGTFTDESALHYTNTRGAYKALADGEADVIFCAAPSDEQMQYARSKGVALELVPIGREAFVFIVNKKNPVDDLMVDQIKGIYTGKYRRWSELGGDDSYIDARQRNAGSGSQTSFLKLMNGEDTSGASRSLTGRSIGFSFRYYVEGLNVHENVKMLSLNGVYPDKANIADGSYPLADSFYAIYDKKNDMDNIKILIDWILSDEGQRIVEESGYTGVFK